MPVTLLPSVAVAVTVLVPAVEALVTTADKVSVEGVTTKPLPLTDQVKAVVVALTGNITEFIVIPPPATASFRH